MLTPILPLIMNLFNLEFLEYLRTRKIVFIFKYLDLYYLFNKERSKIFRFSNET